MKQGMVHFTGAVFLVLLGLSAGFQPVLACVAEAVRPELREEDPSKDGEQGGSEQGSGEETDDEENTISYRSDVSEMIHRPARVFRVAPFVEWLTVRASEQTKLPRIATRPIARLARAPLPVSIWGRPAHWPCGPPTSIVF